MESRRSFIKNSSMSLMALSLPISGLTACTPRQSQEPFTPLKPKNALVFWYSQTGNTARTGKVIARELEAKGLVVDAGEYRQIDKASLTRYDLVVAGSPVYYYDVPENFQTWLSTIPEITGIPVASYVTFGGEGGNTHNTACTLLELLISKGGIPVGLNTFGNMSAFALTWSYGNVERILKYSHLPNQDSFSAMRQYAVSILSRVKKGQPVNIKKEVDFRELIKANPSIWLTKLFIGKHEIDEERCTGCETCLDKCPVDAIDLPNYQVDTDRCLACLGCVNNCPEGAVDMEFMGKKVYGYHEFLEKNHIRVAEPV